MKIMPVTTPEEFDTAFQIRLEVFVSEQRVPEEEELDAQDAQALHLLALDANKAVGTGRVYLDGDTAIIGRLAVCKSYRGLGVGKKLCERLIEAGTDRGAARFLLHAQVQAMDFYKRLGFLPEGEIFSEAGIDHIRMRKENI